jgi:hypothetical protein
MQEQDQGEIFGASGLSGDEDRDVGAALQGRTIDGQMPQTLAL